LLALVKKADNSFYTESTTPGTEENIALLNDIDTMARKLKQVQDAGVPVLFLVSDCTGCSMTNLPMNMV